MLRKYKEGRKVKEFGAAASGFWNSFILLGFHSPLLLKVLNTLAGKFKGIPIKV